MGVFVDDTCNAVVNVGFARWVHGRCMQQILLLVITGQIHSVWSWSLLFVVTFHILPLGPCDAVLAPLVVPCKHSLTIGFDDFSGTSAAAPVAAAIATIVRAACFPKVSDIA